MHGRRAPSHTMSTWEDIDISAGRIPADRRISIYQQSEGCRKMDVCSADFGGQYRLIAGAVWGALLIAEV